MEHAGHVRREDWVGAKIVKGRDRFVKRVADERSGKLS